MSALDPLERILAFLLGLQQLQVGGQGGYCGRLLALRLGSTTAAVQGSPPRPRLGTPPAGSSRGTTSWLGHGQARVHQAGSEVSQECICFLFALPALLGLGLRLSSVRHCLLANEV